jgi:hypothetical protein
MGRATTFFDFAKLHLLRNTRGRESQTSNIICLRDWMAAEEEIPWGCT